MGGASKLHVLLAAQLPLPAAIRVGRRSGARLTALLASSSYAPRLLSSSLRPRLSFTVRGAARTHGQAADAGAGYVAATTSSPSSIAAHPWPEWSRLVDFLFAGGYYDRRVPVTVDDGDDDSLLAGEALTEEFVKAAEACLLFARDRPDLLSSLEKKDIEIIVEHGSPFLFKNGSNSTRRLRSYLTGVGNNGLEIESAKTFDVMRLLAAVVNVSTACEEVNLSESTPEQSVLRQQSSRPASQNTEMKRGDWICPKCSFMNFARNMRCLECNDARPKRVLTGGEWECPQCDFYNYGRNMSCLRCDCRHPGEAPQNIATTGVGLQYNRSSTIQSNADQPSGLGRMDSSQTSESSVSQRLDRILGHSSTLSGSNHQAAPAELNGEMGNSSEYRDKIPSERRDYDSVPSVSLPKNMFSGSHNAHNDVQRFPLTEDSASSMRTRWPSESTIERFNSTRESKGGDSSDAAEKWSKKVGDLDIASAPASTISDDDFPEIMPMRKDYFAKKDKHPETSPITKDSASEALVTHEKSQTISEKLEENKTGISNFVSSEKRAPPSDIQSTGQSNVSRTSNANLFRENLNEHKAGNVYDGSAVISAGTPAKPPFGTQGGDDDAAAKESSQNVKEGLRPDSSRKSLEGSLVKEPDPLDMSEEAKAARWFRRVAQIKDISELSNIPDEDFPEIMPMRKGVNRFVVSKRKTPLERRLTSPQYRRNLPVVNSDPEKNGN
ncbi:hypothetical protein OPV22_024634 [Ensete ventricosum]|uniref:RanBP2-type domain-containing protein n=1 Tax=Ensete ventricosum TaxID=4639 RepID=A0AAV8P8U7_ENSVE|nr:hypothetical protein OPV22_024634 [Ensete ventricosum]